MIVIKESGDGRRVSCCVCVRGGSDSCGVGGGQLFRLVGTAVGRGLLKW